MCVFGLIMHKEQQLMLIYSLIKQNIFNFRIIRIINYFIMLIIINIMHNFRKLLITSIHLILLVQQLIHITLINIVS